jgi:hypothetical protein
MQRNRGSPRQVSVTNFRPRLGYVDVQRRVRESVVGSAVSIVVSSVVIALVGGLLVLLEPEASTPGTSVTGSYSVATKGPGPYGSGTLGPWQHLLRRVSPEDQIRDVLTFDGVFMFGDSIAVQDSAALERLLADRTGDSIAFHDWSGQPASAAVDALAQWQRDYGLPRRIIMAVGTNDIFDPPAFTAQVERALKIAGPDRTVYWVNVYASRLRQPSGIQDADLANSQWINQQLEDAALRHPNLRIIRWSEFLSAQPDGPSTYLRDGVHTSEPAGGNARNNLIVQALQTPRR